MTNNPSELNFDILFPSTTPPTTHRPPQKNAYTVGYGVTSFSRVPGWLGNKQTNKQTHKLHTLLVSSKTKTKIAFTIILESVSTRIQNSGV